MESSIALNKAKQWYGMLDTLDKITFLEHVYKIDRWKLDFASMPDSLRKFYDPKAEREK